MERRHLPRESRPGSSPGLPRARPARLKGRNSERLGPHPGKAPAWSPCSPLQRERERQTLQGLSLPPPERSRFAREPSRHLSGRLLLPPGRTESWSLSSARNGHVCVSGTVAVAAARGPLRDSEAREPLVAWESGIRLRLPKVAKRSTSGGLRSPKRHRCRCCRAKAALGAPAPKARLPRCTRGLSGAPFYSCLYGTSSCCFATRKSKSIPSASVAWEISFEQVPPRACALPGEKR